MSLTGMASLGTVTDGQDQVYTVGRQLVSINVRQPASKYRVLKFNFLILELLRSSEQPLRIF